MERLQGKRLSYYEVFKACRLCGSGGGYKMPILQPTPHDHPEPELRHKIKDCCSIDVHPNDKMPPLICELCVDKVNDFYEFREMCRATNSKVRASLGLPAQTLTQEVSEDCILGVSGPVIYNSKEVDMTRIIPQKNKPKVTFAIDAKNAEKGKAKNKPIPKKIVKIDPEPVIIGRRCLRGDTKPKDESLLAERLSGNKKRERRTISPEPPPAKRLKVTKKAITPAKTLIPILTMKSKMETKKQKESAKEVVSAFSCILCKAGFSKQKILTHHLVSQHSPVIISEKQACAPCREWFTSVRLAEEHHKWHKNSSTFYHCHRCSAEFKVLQSYNKHFSLRQCIPEEIVPDPVCTECQMSFATNYLLKEHNCKGASLQDNQCPKCRKIFPKRVEFKLHKSSCTFGNVSFEINPNNPYLKGLKSIQIAMPKCDNMLRQIKREPEESEDSQDANLIDVKPEPLDENFNDAGVDLDIKHEIKEEYVDYLQDNDYRQNESSNEDSSVSDLETTRAPHYVINPFARKSNLEPESLSYISLRSIFSNKLFRKKAKKRTLRNGKVQTVQNMQSNTSHGNGGESNLFNEKNILDPVITSVCGSEPKVLDLQVSGSLAENEKINTNIEENKADEIQNQDSHENKENECNDNDKLVNIVTTNTDLDSVQKSINSDDVSESTENVNEKYTNDTRDEEVDLNINNLSTENVIKNGTKESCIDDILESKEKDNSIQSPSESEDNLNDSMDINLEIDKILQGELSELAYKKQKEMSAITGSTKNGEKTINESNQGDEDMQSHTVRCIGDTSDNNVQISVEINDEFILNNSRDSVIKQNDLESRFEQESIPEKPENDILDLVSDSGDDCNIIDSPDKLKSFDDQLLADDAEDVKETNETNEPPSKETFSSQLTSFNDMIQKDNQQCLNENTESMDIQPEEQLPIKDSIECIEASFDFPSQMEIKTLQKDQLVDIPELNIADIRADELIGNSPSVHTSHFSEDGQTSEVSINMQKSIVESQEDAARLQHTEMDIDMNEINECLSNEQFESV